MELKEKAEELLEALWIRTEERKEEPPFLADLGRDEETVAQLLDAGYISLVNDRIILTDAGRPVATNVVRRHRLAERLLADVLDTADILLDEKACKFEHILDDGLDDAICTLLGHPPVCPHNRPIPPGRCCQIKEDEAQRVVAPLAELSPRQEGKIAYLHAPGEVKLQKLMSLGILPGTPIKLVQRFPSFVFEVGHSQFAVDKELADAIYVRLVKSTTLHREENSLLQRLGHRWRWRKRQRGEPGR